MTNLVQRLTQSKFARDTAVLQIGKVGATVLSAISALIAWRALGPEVNGVFNLALGFVTLWHTLDLTGIPTSISTHLGMAVGARSANDILDALAVYVRVTTMVNLAITTLIVLLGPLVAAQLYEGDSQIGVLAVGLAFTAIADSFYNLVIIGLQSRRQMRTIAFMSIANQLVLTLCVLAAVILVPTAAGLVGARLVYSYTTMLLALWLYGRERQAVEPTLPPLIAVARRAQHVPTRKYLWFGFANAVDKNLAAYFTQLPLQLVGTLAGARAAGYLGLALNGISYLSILTSAVFDNMQAVVPQMVGRQEFARLRRAFPRVLIGLAFGGIFVYGALALFAPPLIPPVLGERWIPAIPAVMTLALLGIITTVGGVLGPLYRALNVMWRIIAIKILSLAAGLIVGYGLISQWHVTQSPFAISTPEPYRGLLESYAAQSGAWTINLIFIISVTLTAVAALRELWRR
ncbi:MAG: oligosaccharide flippase family protein [Anaerolineae bacterium]|nr:oligosaccharide flippase family protein [Anaerolineae bacterium]MCA9910226.1 oligosaccharide flippase family protein [Anaerolineae bacterium]